MDKKKRPVIYVGEYAKIFVPSDIWVMPIGKPVPIERPEPKPVQRPKESRRQRRSGRSSDERSRSRRRRESDPLPQPPKGGWNSQRERWEAWRPTWFDWPLGWDEEDDGGGGPDTPVNVPPEILALAEKAMTHWKMKVSGMTLAATKPEKGWGAIWRIETDHGPRSFKLLHRPFERNLFSIHAQEYLTQQKARVAPLVRSTAGELYSVVDGRMFICTEWIQGLHPASKVTPEGAAALCYGLGEFHRFSRGYQPPEEAYFATRMHRWPGVYQKVRTKINWFEHLAQAYAQLPASSVLLKVLPRFRAQADEAIRLLERSAYRELVARGPQAWGLVHQDE